MVLMAGVVVDAAIGWLVQSILGNLFTEKLEAWDRRVGLADDVEKLKSDMRYVQMVLAAARGRKIENGPLMQSLGDLKQLLYEAEDVMDELDYYSIQEQVISGEFVTHINSICFVVNCKVCLVHMFCVIGQPNLISWF